MGLPRDQAWADLVTRVDRGICVAVDYGHRRAARPPRGSLAGHRAGRLVPPRPDGSCDLTAEVALDSLAAAAGNGVGAGALLRTQAEALRDLGVAATRPAPPDPSGGRAATSAYLRDLQRAGAAAELLDAGGLGGFGWLERQVATGQPEPATARVVR